MRKNIHVLLFTLLNSITIFSVLYCNRDVNPFPISACYQNVFVFLSCIFFTNRLLFKKKEKIENLSSFVKQLLFYNGIICCIVFILGFFIALALGGQNFFFSLLITIFQLFLLLVLHSLFIFLVTVDKQCKVKSDNYFLGILIFIYLFYIFIYSYGNNILFINIYRYFFMGLRMYAFWHYLFWFFVVCVIIGVKCRKHLGEMYDRIKKYKKRV